jgi:hypothetical protein
MRKEALLLLSVFGILGCGGGGGGGSSSVSSSTSSQNSEVTTGTIKSSYVKGMKVCIKYNGDNICTYTDRNGHFEFPFKTNFPIKISLYFPYGIKLTDYEMKENDEIIDTFKLANNNDTLALEIGSILHGLAGDTEGNQDYISLYKSEITGIYDENGNVINENDLISILKKYPKVEIKFQDLQTYDIKTIKTDSSNREFKLCNIEGNCKNIHYPLYNWTIAIIYGADNNLEEFAKEDIRELQLVKIPRKIKVVGLVDLESQNGTFIFNTINGQYKLTGTLPESNLGNPSYIYTFLKSVFSKLPSKYRAVIFWGHGIGYKKLQDNSNNFKISVVDETNKDILYNAEMVYIFKKLKEDGIKVNLIGFDECLMGNMENFYELSDYTDWLVGSELEEGGNGWDYTKLFVKVAQNPNLTPQQFGKYIVDAYRDEYEYTRGQYTMILANSEQIKTIVNNLNSLVEKINDFQTIQLARENSLEIPTYGAGEFSHRLVDLYSFINELNEMEEYTENLRIIKTINDMYKFIKGGNYKGLNIYFPLDKGYDDKDYYCISSNQTGCNGYFNPFAIDTKWDDFVKTYLQTISQ